MPLSAPLPPRLREFAVLRAQAFRIESDLSFAAPLVPRGTLMLGRALY